MGQVAAAAEGAEFAVEVLVVRCKDRQLVAAVVVGGWDLLQPGLGGLVVVAAGQHRGLEQFVHLEIMFTAVSFPVIFICYDF